MVGGSIGGTVVADASSAVYTAPSSVGTYHVCVRVLGGPSDVLATHTLTILAKAPE